MLGMFHIPLEIGRQALDQHAIFPLFNRSNRLREVICSPVGHIVAIDRRDDDVANAPGDDGLGGVDRLRVWVKELGCG